MNETSKLGYVLQAVNIFGSALRTGLVLPVARPTGPSIPLLAVETVTLLA